MECVALHHTLHCCVRARQKATPPIIRGRPAASAATHTHKGCHMLNQTRRLSSEEIAARLPKMLAEHRTKMDVQAVKAAVVAHQHATKVKIGVGVGDALRSAYANGLRVRGKGGRFLPLPKSA